MGGIFEWMERAAGDGKIAKNLRDYTKYGRTQFEAGGGLTNEALSGIRGDIGGYEDRLRSGRVLSSNVRQAFEQARGGIKDQSLRNALSLKSRLSNARATSGGRLSEAQIQALTAESEESNGANTFAALNDIFRDEANLELVETNKVLDRLTAARNAILATGQSERDRAAAMEQFGLNSRLYRLNAIANTVVAGASMGAKGGGGSTGGLK
jgi:hypothetical protein